MLKNPSALKIFKKIIRVFLWTLTGLPILAALVCVAVYVPGVQKFAVGKVSAIVAEKTGMSLSVEKFRIRFPVGVSIYGATLLSPAGDTLAGVGALRARAALVPLLSGRVLVRDVSLGDAHSTWRDTASGISIRARVGGLTVGRASVILKNRSVSVSRASLDGADVALSIGGGRDSGGPGKDSASAAPWSVDVRRFDLSHARFAMDILPDTVPSAAPFDPRRIRADSVGLRVRDLRYGGGDISARFDGLHLAERSGLRVTDGGGDLSMTSGGLSLHDLALVTGRSKITADATAGAGVLRAEGTAPVSLTLSASVSADDVLLFAPLPGILHGEELTLETTLDGTLDDISIERLSVSLPDGSVSLDARGTLRRVTEPRNLSGEVAFDGELRGFDLVNGFIADTALRRRIAFPHPVTLRGEGSFSPGDYRLSQLVIAADSGHLEAAGRFSVREKSYDATVRLTGFPLGDLLPRDSLGVATLSLEAHGRGFDPAGDMTARARLSVDRFDYRSTDFGVVKADVSVSGGRIEGTVRSRSGMLDTDIALDVRLGRDTLPGRPVNYALYATVDSTVVRIGGAAVRIDPATIRASASAAGSSAAVHSGDLSVDLSSPLSLDSLLAGVRSVGGEVRRQLATRHFSADSLQSAFPGVRLTAKVGRGNFLREIALTRGFDFRTLSADISTTDGAPFGIEGEVTGFGTGKFILDTIGVQARRNGTRLDYSLRLANRPGNNDHLGLVTVSGSAGGNTLSVDLYQRNRSDSVGFRFGVNASLQGKTLRAEMTPANPVLGYRQWAVWEGGWLEYDTDGKFRADLHLRGPSEGEYVDMTSASLPDIPDGALRLRMSGIAIAPVLDLLPAAPPLGGTVSSDLVFGLRDGVIAAKGAFGVGSLSYDRQRVGDIDATVDFQSDATGRMSLDGSSVTVDKITSLTADGYYTKEAMDFTLAIPALPLSVAGAFLPAGAATLSGDLDGKVHITGPPTAPVLTGDVGFTDAKASVGMTGTTFGISPDRITIDNNKLVLNNFGIVAPNGQKLAVDGTLDISDLSRTTADVRISASDFRVVDSRHIGGSQVYGTAAFDADITARGALSTLTVRGDIAVSGATDIVYILRNQSRVRDEKQHIVEFTVFADSLFMPEAGDLPRLRRAGVDMLVGVNIGEGAKATMSLDEVNENRVELAGGGDLAFSMNTQGDVRLAGRYTLSGGTVYYRPPVIPQKVFAVRDGSYVEWTGEAAAPEFHVTATQTSDIDLDYEDGSSEQVAFDISVDISGSLKAIDMRFDVAAPGNLAIQNQLLSMSTEVRMQQALTLLVYGQYTGPGVSTRGASFDARNTLNDFISKEVNQWARNNLKGVDLSMGIDTKGDASGDTHTNYSYSVSKSMFSDRVKVSVGGSVSDNSTSRNFADNLLDDITLEYRLTQRDNMFLKLYRLGTRESILEGEVTETGGGFLMRKKMNRFGDLFRRNKKKNEK